MSKSALMLFAILLAGCASTRVESLRLSSLRLQDRAGELYTEIRKTGDDSRSDRLSRDAQALAVSARDLNRAAEVSTRDARRRDTEADQMGVEFDRVARNYTRLREDMATEGFAEQHRSVLQDFDRVTEAYRVVENSFASRTASAGGNFGH